MAELFGFNITVYYLCSATMGFLLLETVNYIEHYGLQRKINSNGKYERVQPFHSWNSNHPIGRIMLFELSRHSDHHYNSYRKYQVLKKNGFKNIELDSIIESKHILKRSGGNFRQYLFSFYDQNYTEYALRSDLSIASVIKFISE